MRHLILVAVLCAGCGGGSENPAAPSAPTPSAIQATERQFCLDRTNEYRATVGRPPLRQSGALDQYADAAAAYDAARNAPHAYFTGPGKGQTRAENQIWASGVSMRAAIQNGLAEMWAEGSGGPHHENIRGAYSEMGCGAVRTGGTLVIVQAFR